MPRLPEKTKIIAGKPRRDRAQGYGSEPFQRSPVVEGQEIDMVIDDIGKRGHGITHMTDFLIFVPRTRVGERLRVKVVKVMEDLQSREKLAA